MPADLAKQVLGKIRDVPDYPKPGILFKDITPLLGDHAVFSEVVAEMGRDWGRIDKIVGIEARGFILAAPVAYRTGSGFVPVRKIGKLPYATWEQTYDLEYGSATLEVHRDAFLPDERVLIVDDVLATGGTAQATASLIRRAGGEVAGLAVLLELLALGGRDRLAGMPVRSLVACD